MGDIHETITVTDGLLTVVRQDFGCNLPMPQFVSRTPAHMYRALFARKSHDPIRKKVHNPPQPSTALHSPPQAPVVFVQGQMHFPPFTRLSSRSVQIRARRRLSVT